MISKIIVTVFSAICVLQVLVRSVDLATVPSSMTPAAIPKSAAAPTITAKAAPGTRSGSPISDEALDKALSDKRYLQQQLKCALGEAPCDLVGKRLKSLAPFVLRGACPQCTQAEKKHIQKTLAHVQRNYPQQWNKLIQQYAG